MASHGIEAEVDAAGWRFRLSRRGGLFSKAGVITPDAWTAGSFPNVPGVALLRVLREGGQAEPDGDAVRLSHDSVAGLTAAEAVRLGLPPVCTHGLFLEREAPIGTPQFRVRATWTARNVSTILRQPMHEFTLGCLPFWVEG